MLGTDDIKELIKGHITNFPGIMLDNDYRVEWLFGDTYTFEPMEGSVESYGKFVLLTQELDVYRISELGERKLIGKTKYVKTVEDSDLTGVVNYFSENGEPEQYFLQDALYYAVDEMVKGFGLGESIQGCTFMTNKENVIFTKDEFINVFIKRIRESLDNFYTDLLMLEDFNKGLYRIKIPEIEVGVSRRDGWGVKLGIEVQHYKALVKKNLELKLSSGIKDAVEVPSVKELQDIASKELDRFIRNNKRSEYFGITFIFMDDELGKHSPYAKITVEDIELVNKWRERFYTVLSNYRDDLTKYITGIKEEEGFGFYLRISDDLELVFCAGGIMTKEGREIYIRKEDNLQEGLRKLSQVLGKSRFVLDIMKTYDFRTKVKGD